MVTIRHYLLLLLASNPSRCACAFSIRSSKQRLDVKGHSQPDLLTFAASNKKYTNQLAATGTGGATEDQSESSSIIDSASSDLVNKGRFLLFLVALLYGTLNVSLRLVYALPDPPSAAALSVTRGWLATACFVPLLAKKNIFKSQKNNSLTAASTSDEASSATLGSSSTTSALWMAALELAIYNLGAQGLLTVGLLSTGSARAAFLTQTSVVITPLISLVAGQAIAKQVWFGSVVALVGGLVLLSGGSAAAGAASGLFAFGKGDLLVMGAAFCWSLYMFRLSKIGNRHDEIQLQARKTLVVAVFYSLWLLGSFFTFGSAALWLGWNNVVAWALLLFSAIGPGVLADILQQQGQKHVTASEANVILSLEPVFAALCAWLLLGEVTSLQEGIGGGLILLAALIATR
jgi:drug/metabolite transporter (DMT)-like permease